MAQHEKRAIPKLHNGRSSRYLRELEEDLSEEQVASEKVRAASIEWLAALCPWDLYATLTYDPSRAGYAPGYQEGERRPPSNESCEHHVAAYVRALSKGLARRVSAVAAVEHHKNGWPHAHALIAMGGCDADAFVLAAHGWFCPHGFVHLVRVVCKDTQAIAAYLLKYFSKETATIVLAGPLDETTGQGQVNFRWKGKLAVTKSEVER